MAGRRILGGLLIGAALLLLLPAAGRAQTVIIGTVGQGSITSWPLYIAVSKGFFEAEGIKPDFVYTPGNAPLVQQLAAGSLDMALSAGLVDPIRAIDKGAPVAIVAVEIQSPPYALLSKPTLKQWSDLKGKIVSVGGAKDITRIFVERMAVPNGVKPGDYDMVYAGATSARFSALQSGAVDAAILLPPFNFYAESAGFANLGFTVDYADDLPFSGSIANRNWAAKNPETLKKLMGIGEKSIRWFLDPQNRDEAIRIMVEASKLKPEDVGKSYDFLHKHKYYENVGKVSKAKLGRLIQTLRDLGDLEGAATPDRFVMTGATALVD